jgi:inhibitor of KinA
MYEKIKRFGSNALLLEWPQIISDDITDEIIFYCQYIQDANMKGIIDIVPAYASLAIFYNPVQLNMDSLVQFFEHIKYTKSENQDQVTWTIPVKYNDESSEDLIALIHYTGLDRQKILDLHSHSIYKVCFIGFLPGFLYLSGLDKAICMPRKKVPALKVQKGSVAIGGCQTGIYPVDSPGGWHVIGHTDSIFIQFNEPPYCRINPGDLIRFESV